MMEENKKLKVIIVDDNEVFRSGIRYFIQSVLKHSIVAEFSDGEEIINSDKILEADIILMDIEMPKLNGLDTTKKILWKYSMLKLVAITNFKDKAYLSELIGVGFKGCVFKDNIYEELPKAIETVISNNVYYPEDIKL